MRARSVKRRTRFRSGLPQRRVTQHQSGLGVSVGMAVFLLILVVMLFLPELLTSRFSPV